MEIFEKRENKGFLPSCEPIGQSPTNNKYMVNFILMKTKFLIDFYSSQEISSYKPLATVIAKLPICPRICLYAVCKCWIKTLTLFFEIGNCLKCALPSAPLPSYSHLQVFISSSEYYQFQHQHIVGKTTCLSGPVSLASFTASQHWSFIK